MKDYIPAKQRRRIYGIFATIGVAFGATQVGYSAAGQDQPTSLTVSLAVFSFVSGAVGFVAASNTTPTIEDVDGEHEA